MADHSDTTVSDKRQRPPDAEDAGDHAKDPITIIFDRFWAKLQTRLQPAGPCQTSPMRVRASGGREHGSPPQGNFQTLASKPHILGPPELRARRGVPQRRWPHKRREARRTPKRPDLTPRTTPKGPTLDHEGPQARGLRAPALPQLWGRRELPQPRHRGSTLMGLNSSVRTKPGRQPTTGGCRACSDKTLNPVLDQGKNSLLTAAALSDCLDVLIRTRQAELCTARQQGQRPMNPRDDTDLPSRGIG
ncbi:Hypothetical predicted protein [Pelobates cultripes]|uniref:Uncharacterized protein n=1 Tax=Pelobates cultripes TaxID=61616 RepID=A0AAD1VJ47_PELCU|nr:Hypothetical predicted protein [Pelobates cultripes]